MVNNYKGYDLEATATYERGPGPEGHWFIELPQKCKVPPGKNVGHYPVTFLPRYEGKGTLRLELKIWVRGTT